MALRRDYEVTMLAQSRQDEQLNSLTDDLLKRGIATTKLDAKRLALSMMGKETGASPTRTAIPVSNLVQQSVSSQSISALEQQLSQTKQMVELQQNQIAQLQSELSQMKDHHSVLNEKIVQLHSHMDKVTAQESPDTKLAELEPETKAPEVSSLREQYTQEEKLPEVEEEVLEEVLNLESNNIFAQPKSESGQSTQQNSANNSEADFLQSVNTDSQKPSQQQASVSSGSSQQSTQAENDVDLTKIFYNE